MMRSQLQRAIENTGIPMRLSKWLPGDYHCRHRGGGTHFYQLTDDADSTELSDVMNRSEMYSNLYTLNRLFYQINVTKLRRFQEQREIEKKKKK